MITTSGAGTGISVQVLERFTVRRAGAELDLRGPRHRAVLARLLVARGRTVPIDWLLADLWPSPDGAPAGDGARASLLTLVSNLRRVLEPERPPRAPARLLVSAAPGYALRIPAEAVDARRFESLARQAVEQPDGPGPERLLSRTTEALALWQGPAYREFADQPWAAPEIARLRELHHTTVERRCEALLALGRTAEAIPDLAAFTEAEPLREEAWRLLALALYRDGRQGDALAALRRARTELGRRLGVDPGPRLRRLTADILAQAPHLDLDPDLDPGLDPGLPDGARPAGPPTTEAASATTQASRATTPSTGPTTGPTGLPADLLVGRTEELAVLRDRAVRAATGRHLQLALVSGEAGAGKTALVERFVHDLTAEGWTAAWGQCPETDGLPPAWPWTQLLTTLLEHCDPDTAPPEPIAPLLAATPADEPARPGPPGDAARARFRRHEAVRAFLLSAPVRRRGPLVLVLDDLHRADQETLLILGYLVDARVPLLLVLTHRPDEPSPAVTDTLGRLATADPARVQLTGLAPEAVRRMLGRVLAGPIPDDLLAAVMERTGGNPFFVRETARMLAVDGLPTTLGDIPDGIREVLRRRVLRLPPQTVDLLRHAAVLGRDAPVDVLTDLFLTPGPPGTPDRTEAAALEAVDRAVAAGLLLEPAPGLLRFAHLLVRDTLYEDLSLARRTRRHGATADALLRLRPKDADAIAHHLFAAADPARSAETVRWIRAAADAATARAAFGEAVELSRRALAAHDRSGTEDARGRVALQIGLISALAVDGDLIAARQEQDRTVSAARRLGDSVLTARAVGALGSPAPMPSRPYGSVNEELVDTIDALLAELPDTDRAVRCELLVALAQELEGETGADGRRGHSAAREAERIARDLGHPVLLAHSLMARYLHEFHHFGTAPERLRIGRELLRLARRHELAAFEVYGRIVLMHVHAGLGEFDAARIHADAAAALNRRVRLRIAELLLRGFEAMRAVVAGRFEDALERYAHMANAMRGTDIWGITSGLRAGGSYCVAAARRNAEDLTATARTITAIGNHSPADLPSLETDYRLDTQQSEAFVLRALMLDGAGSPAELRERLRAAPATREDVFRELKLCLAAQVALAVETDARLEARYRELLPAEHAIAGAEANLPLVPVAQVLGELAERLGDRDAADRHYRTALALARRIDSPHWQADAERGLRCPGSTRRRGRRG
ncbi:BTAD domain-containing putative transcriptional regulator [Kitasatospora brasiliensis]|uniref:BTAD domain-containing putative transcriptional regulator n=1 Tax=Kitasatospora brasiliensis TaxID=3058040 RepID=UPI0029301397|nr:BTAD domain-containing putative transcriptional regulator [Kitasatospora sp. K002]